MSLRPRAKSRGKQPQGRRDCFVAGSSQRRCFSVFSFIMRILFVEPDEYYHAHFREIFGKFGDILIAPDAQRAAAFLQSSPPDVLVTELLLPDVSGYEFLQDISEEWQQNPFPVIIFSQITHVEDMAASLNIGISAYFTKGRDQLRDLEKAVLSFNKVSSL